MNNRRIVMIPVALGLVVEMCTQGFEAHFRTGEGLPADAQFIGSTFDAATCTAYLIFASEMFEEVPPHGKAPIVEPSFYKIETPMTAPEVKPDPIIPEDPENENPLD